jgi:hypothetical protein
LIVIAIALLGVVRFFVGVTMAVRRCPICNRSQAVVGLPGFGADRCLSLRGSGFSQKPTLSG